MAKHKYHDYHAHNALLLAVMRLLWNVTAVSDLTVPNFEVINKFCTCCERACVMHADNVAADLDARIP